MQIELPLPVLDDAKKDVPHLDHLAPDNNPTYALCGVRIRGIEVPTTQATNQLCVVCEDIAATFRLVIK